MASELVGVEVRRKTTETYTMKLTGERLLHLLREAGYTAIPNSATATFQVPRGGDWSGTAVEIDNEHVITVTWAVQS